MIIFSGSCSIDHQRADDTTRPLTAVHSVRPNTGSVRRVCDMEWRYRTWYVYTVCVQALCIGSLINGFPGDKSNHVASFHLPQLYYFIAFATIMGWPALVSGDSGWKALANDVRYRIFGNKRRVLIACAWCEV